MKVGRTLLIWLKTHRIGDSPPIRESPIFFFSSSFSSIFSQKPWKLRGKVVSLPPNKYNIYIFMIMRTGDKVLISPDLTHAKDWTQGEVIEVENNPFVGIVISAKTADGNIFFGYKDLFEPAKDDE